MQIKKRIIMLGGLTLASLNAQALTIGDIEMRSVYGERFSARIPLALATGEDVMAGCVRLENLDSPSAGVPMLANYRVIVEPVQNGKSAVLLSTVEAVTEPVVRVGLVVRCAKTRSEEHTSELQSPC